MHPNYPYPAYITTLVDGSSSTFLISGHVRAELRPTQQALGDDVMAHLATGHGDAVAVLLERRPDFPQNP